MNNINSHSSLYSTDMLNIDEKPAPSTSLSTSDHIKVVTPSPRPMDKAAIAADLHMPPTTDHLHTTEAHQVDPLDKFNNLRAPFGRLLQENKLRASPSFLNEIEGLPSEKQEKILYLAVVAYGGGNAILDEKGTLSGDPIEGGANAAAKALRRLGIVNRGGVLKVTSSDKALHLKHHATFETDTKEALSKTGYDDWAKVVTNKKVIARDQTGAAVRSESVVFIMDAGGNVQSQLPMQAFLDIVKAILADLASQQGASQQGKASTTSSSDQTPKILEALAQQHSLSQQQQKIVGQVIQQTMAQIKKEKKNLKDKAEQTEYNQKLDKRVHQLLLKELGGVIAGEAPGVALDATKEVTKAKSLFSRTFDNGFSPQAVSSAGG